MIHFHFLTRRRSNLDLGWGSGVFSGTLMASNDALIGLSDGDVARARSIAPSVPNQRWCKDAIMVAKGVPANPRPVNPVDDGVIDAVQTPHLAMDAEVLAMLKGDDVLTSGMPVCLHEGRQLPSLRITKADLRRYQYTPGCPRCLNTQVWDTSATAKHGVKPPSGLSKHE